MFKHLLIIFFFVTSLQLSAQNKYTISGYIKEKSSFETLPGANVTISGKQIQSNNYGFYAITLGSGNYSIKISVAGYQILDTSIILDQNLNQDFYLISNNILNEVVVNASAKANLSEQINMSTIDIPIQQIKDIPALLGEKDVFKVIKLLPGIQKGTEGSSGFYVRGGSPDQNLIILDDAVVYNANHLFGFFSVFNGDALKSVELIKGGFPARYGERLSSVLNLTMKDGNKKELHGEAGFGLLSSRLTLEGPIKKDKSSFLISGRRTYADIFIQPLLDKDQSSGYYFYDFNAKFQADLDSKNRIFLSGYFGQDKLYDKYKYDDGYDKLNFKWGNATSTFRWNHIFGSKLFTNASLIFSQYNLENLYEDKSANDLYRSTNNSSIRDFSFKYDADYFLNPQHSLKGGLKMTNHRFIPNAFVLKDTGSGFEERSVKKFDSFETNLYVEDEWNATNKLGINYGLRASSFTTEGTNYTYLEPRFSFRYLLNQTTGIKGSYALMHQYLHLLSNTGEGFPTDLWVPSSQRIKPERADQVALGFTKDLTEKSLQLSVETYYKKLQNIITYKEGASFLDIGVEPDQPEQLNYEDNITAGKGRSMGVELFLQKKTGRLNGWIGYTLSKTVYQFDEVNFGKEYFPRQDRRHDFSLVALYQLSPKIKLNFNFVFSSGNALTLPRNEYFAYTNQINVGSFGVSAIGVQDYGERGSFRAESYHRIDVGAQFYKKKKKSERTFEVGFYNAYNRLNPFFYDIQYKDNQAKLYKFAFFPIIPSVSWNYKF